MAFPPERSISDTTPSTALRSLRPLTTTAAPPAANPRAIARPMFLPAPLTNATLPTSGGGRFGSIVVAWLSNGNIPDRSHSSDKGTPAHFDRQGFAGRGSRGPLEDALD